MPLSAMNLTFEIHDELNPEIWEGDNLNSSVKDKLLDIAQAFIDSLEVELEVEDVTLTGSLANFNYTKYSDFDLHIITDFKGYDVDPALLKDYLNTKKTVWNTSRDIRIKNYAVEVYIQDKNEPHHSSGVYSLKTDTWIKKPKAVKNKIEIDKGLIHKKVQSLLDIIDFALGQDCSIEDADKAKDHFMELRKAGLLTGGDLAPENIAFKELRRSGDIERFFKGVITKKDKKLSLSEKLDFKTFTGIANKRGPRHQSLGAGMNKAAGAHGKSIGMVAQDHKVGDEYPALHRLKSQTSGYIVIPYPTAQQIASQYNLAWDKIQRGQPIGLSTSGIQLGFNAQTNAYYLRK